MTVVKEELSMIRLFLSRSYSAGCVLNSLIVTLSASIGLADDQVHALPHDTVEQWKRAGAVSGYLGWDHEGSLVFRQGPGVGKRGDWPAFSFRFPRWDPEKVKTLIAPDQPFALDLRRTSVTDADPISLSPINA